jgi:hypothetical protein
MAGSSKARLDATEESLPVPRTESFFHCPAHYEVTIEFTVGRYWHDTRVQREGVRRWRVSKKVFTGRGFCDGGKPWPFYTKYWFRGHPKRRNCHAFSSILYHEDSHFPVGWFVAHRWTLWLECESTWRTLLHEIIHITSSTEVVNNAWKCYSYKVQWKP